MHKHNDDRRGFTIVELLIVVVVIAILAAISVVAYTNIQNRTHDSVVQNDLNNFAKRITLYYAEFADYPTANTATGIAGIDDISVTKSSYLTNSTYTNLYYCRGIVSGAPAFAVGAISKSNNLYYYSSLQGSVKPYTGAWETSAQICPGMLPGHSGRSYAQGWDRNGYGWYAWTE